MRGRTSGVREAPFFRPMAGGQPRPFGLTASGKLRFAVGRAILRVVAPFSPALNSDHAVEMQGDIIEIVLAALRGHPEFTAVLPSGFGELPQLFTKLVYVCRTVQMLDAFLRTGLVKSQQKPVTRLARLRPDLVDHPFVQIWSRPDLARRGIALVRHHMPAP